MTDWLHLTLSPYPQQWRDTGSHPSFLAQSPPPKPSLPTHTFSTALDDTSHSHSTCIPSTHLMLGHSSHTSWGDICSTKTLTHYNMFCVACWVSHFTWNLPGPRGMVFISVRQLHFLLPGASCGTGLNLASCKCDSQSLTQCSVLYTWHTHTHDLTLMNLPTYKSSNETSKSIVIVPPLGISRWPESPPPKWKPKFPKNVLFN